MKIAVLGSGVVGQTLAAKLAALGHDTMLGTATPPPCWPAPIRAPCSRSRSRHGTSGIPRSPWAASPRRRPTRPGRQRHLRGGLARSPPPGRRGQPGRQGPGRRGQPARLLQGHAAHLLGRQHRLARRADPAGLPRGPGGQVPEHGGRGADGRPRPGRRRRPPHVRQRRRPRRQGPGHEAAHRRLRLASGHRPGRHHQRPRDRDVRGPVAAPVRRPRHPMVSLKVAT